MITEFLKKLLKIILVFTTKNAKEGPNEWLQTIVAFGLFILIIIYGPKSPENPSPIIIEDNKTVENPVRKEQEIIQTPQKNPLREGRKRGRAYPIDPPFPMEKGGPKKGLNLRPNTPPELGKELQKKDK
jgi:hypothetical protein